MTGRMYTVVIAAVNSPSAAFDLFAFVPATTKPIRVRRIRIAQSSEPTTEEEMLGVTVKRGFTSAGSVGSTPTPIPLNSTTPAAGFTARTMDTTVASGGTPVTIMEDVWNIRAGCDIAFAPEEAPEAVNGERLVITSTAPADAVNIRGTVWVEEFG